MSPQRGRRHLLSVDVPPERLFAFFDGEPWDAETQEWREHDGWIVVRQVDEGREERRVLARIVQVIERD